MLFVRDERPASVPRGPGALHRVLHPGQRGLRGLRRVRHLESAAAPAHGTATICKEGEIERIFRPQEVADASKISCLDSPTTRKISCLVRYLVNMWLFDLTKAAEPLWCASCHCAQRTGCNIASRGMEVIGFAEGGRKFRYVLRTNLVCPRKGRNLNQRLLLEKGS